MAAIGIMGGTFDPIHLGHLVVAERAREELALDEILFIPCGVPALPKPYPVTPGEHRYAMAVLATAGHPQFRVSRLEIDRAGPSYTVDTLRTLRAQRGEREAFFFITGADAILQLEAWHDPEALLCLCRFVAVPRPGYDLSRLTEALPPPYSEAVIQLPGPTLDISATDLRARVQAGRSIRYLVPEAVEVYLRKHGLYR